MGVRSLVGRTRRVLLDLTPLRRSAAYRRLYVYGSIGGLMGQATYVALLYQLKGLTGSPFDVGALGLVEFVPILVLGLWGGVLADRFERRLVVMGADALLLASVLVLYVNGRLAHPAIWAIFVVAAVVAGANGLSSPSLAALVQELVPHHLQREAAALEVVQGTSASIAGPALGGLLAVAVGVDIVYLVNAAAFAVTFLLLASVRTARPASTSSRPRIGEGLRYAARRPDVLGTYAVDLVAMVAAYPVGLLAFLAARFPERGALAVLYCAMPVGALIAALTGRWTNRVQRHGRAIVAAAVLWGLGVAASGWGGSLYLAAAALAVAGAADALSGVFRMAMWNESISPDVRGRMAGVETLSYSLGPTAGQFRAGAVAAATTVRASLVIGGLAAAGGCAALGPALRAMWRYDARTDPHVAAVRAVRADGDGPTVT